MKVEEAVKKRRSIRSYLDKKIEKSILEELIYLANLAPTAHSFQNRHFIIIQNKEKMKKIWEHACKQDHVKNASVLIAVAADMEIWDPKETIEDFYKFDMYLWDVNSEEYIKNKDFMRNFEFWKRLWSIQDVDASTTTLILAATEKGIGSCWVGAFDSEKIGEILKIPRNYRVIALITLGYKKQDPWPQKRKETEELIHWENW
ncbi:MAG: nitroreductase family protein [Candidatus Aenigmarchaeota archaeon]|nr:nitroreductase family protein [Candidatus Aenigmarchaeota archaeon]